MNMNFQGGHDDSKRVPNGIATHELELNNGRDITVGAQKQLVDIGTYIEKMLNDEARYVDEDIHRIGSLIHNAMEMLQHSFNNVMVKANEQSGLIDSLITSQESDTLTNDQAMLMSLSESSALIKQEVNHSIRALQFEDITRQLTEHINKRLEHINEIALVAHTGISAASKESELKVVADRLHTMRDDFRNMNIADIVKQQDMSEGDIDLF